MQRYFKDFILLLPSKLKMGKQINKFPYYILVVSNCYSRNLCFQVIQGYCLNTAVPILSNANTPSPTQTLGAITYFTCNFGYQTTGSSLPFFSCTVFNASVGLWSTVTYSCTRTLNCNLVSLDYKPLFEKSKYVRVSIYSYYIDSPSAVHT